MIRVIRKEEQKEKAQQLSEGQLRSIARTITSLLGIVLVEARDEIIRLLQKAGEKVDKQSSDKALSTALMNQVARQNPVFNGMLAAIIEKVVPGLKSEEHDHFTDDPLLDAGKELGTQTAAGAASGGLLGGALGLVGGIFGLANNAQQQKLEKDKASAMTLSSMLQYKAAKLKSSGGLRNAQTIIVVVVLALLTGLGLFFYLRKPKTVSA